MAIARTIDLQREIDEIYPEVERNVLHPFAQAILATLEEP
jgi:hypothetical protein